MVKKNMNKKIEVNIPNRIFYSVIVLAAVVLFLTGVYAYGGSNPPVVGHTLGELQPPYQCNSYLRYTTGTGWSCSTPSLSTPTITCTGSNRGLQWNGVSWSCATYTSSSGGGSVGIGCSWTGWSNPCAAGYTMITGGLCSGDDEYTATSLYCSSGSVSDTQSVICCNA